jgi:hypothetical protein
MDEKKLSDAVNRSGFPLQIALQSLVERTQLLHGWKVVFSEHSWFNPADGGHGFIDLILEDGRGKIVFVVECERVVNCSWIFLIDDMKQMERRHAKAWVTHYSSRSTFTSGSFSRFGFEELEAAPITPQSQYCVVDGQDAKERPMLERLASNVVSSTEGFANEEMAGVQNENGVLRIYFSVIVTTAKLRVCEFDPQSIPLSTGEIANAKYTEVPFLRFRKQLASRREIPKKQLTLYNTAEAKENTVFIVTSESVSDFLECFKVAAFGPYFA